MRTSRGWWIASLLAGAHLVACGGGGSTMDAGADGMPPDGSNMMDGSMSVDGSPSDGARADGATVDVTHYTDPCAGDAVIDVTTATPDSTGVVHVVSDNLGAPMGNVLPTMTMNCPLGLNDG